MLETVQNQIILQLRKISAVKSVGVWQGETEDLLKSPQRLPALSVIYQGAEFNPKKVIGVNRADYQMDFLILLISKNLKSREEGTSDAYTIIEAVRNYLIGHRIDPYGSLWPISEELVLAEGGLLVYGLNYRMETNITAIEP